MEIPNLDDFQYPNRRLEVIAHITDAHGKTLLQ